MLIIFSVKNNSYGFQNDKDLISRNFGISRSLHTESRYLINGIIYFPLAYILDEDDADLSKQPMNEDFGLLRREDIAQYIEVDLNYNWICFEIEKFEAKCDGKWEDDGHIWSEMSLTIYHSKGKDDFWNTRATDFEMCMERKRTWEKLLKDEKYACVGVRSFASDDVELIDGKYTTVRSWFYDQLKTAKGRDCYPISYKSDWSNCNDRF